MSPTFAHVLFLIAVFSNSHVNCNPLRRIEVDTMSNTTELIRKWTSMQNKFETTVKSVLKQALPFLLRAGNEVDLSEECFESVTQLAFGIGQFKPWALKMVDAMGKPTSGILDGTFTSVGAYDQCLNIEVNPNREGGFKGQYCSVTLRPPLPPKVPFYRVGVPLKELQNFTATNFFMQQLKTSSGIFYTAGLRFGLCFPSACSQTDLQNVAQAVASRLDMFARVSNCQTKETVTLATDQIVIICVILAFVATVLLATALNITSFAKTKNNNDSKNCSWQLIRAFSIPYNTTNLFKTDSHPDYADLQCLHGLKVFSMSWVILGHTYNYVNKGSLNNIYNVLNYGKTIGFQTVLGGTFSVDTFFFISGVLLCNATVKMVNKYDTRAFNIPIYIVKRIWRLIPSALLTVGLIMLTPLIGSGPFWHENMDMEIDVCRKNWWAIALSVNNYISPENMCLTHTWYISAEMQLFLCSLLFLWLLFKKKVYGFFMAAFMIVVGMVAPAAIVYGMRFPPTMLISYPDVESMTLFWKYNYLQPYSHSGSYAIGLLLGYYLATTKSIEISRWIRCIGWVVAFGLSASVLYSPVIWHHETHIPTVIESVSYAALHRIGWVLGVAWVTLMCARGYGGVINSILSWKAFLPLSRLTYLVYLLHYIIVWYQSSTLRSTMDSRHEIAVCVMLGNLMETCLVSFVVYIIFDSPLKELQSILLSRFISNKTKNVENLPETNGAKPSIQNGKIYNKNTRL